MIAVRFRAEEAVPNVPMPRDAEFRRRIVEFRDRVKAAREYGLSRNVSEDRTEVGILLPPEDGEGNGYTPQQIDFIASEIELIPRRAVPLRWPPVLDSRFAESIEKLDWIVVDLGPASSACGIVGYLHGRFVPMMRLRRSCLKRPDDDLPSQLERTLFGGFEVGYVKDIVRWNDESNLEMEIKQRILTI